MKKIIARKVFDFGKIDYMDRGRKDCPVSVTVELRECGGEKVVTRDGKSTGEHCNKYIEFSVCGDIWNHLHTDIYCGGQCLDKIAKYVKSPVFCQIYDFWKKYHLNCMHAGTPEQEKAVKEWEAEGNQYDYNAACEMLKKRGLYEVPLNCRLIGTRNADGMPYKYGHGWVIEDIPNDDLKKIICLCK